MGSPIVPQSSWSTIWLMIFGVSKRTNSFGSSALRDQSNLKLPGSLRIGSVNERVSSPILSKRS